MNQNQFAEYVIDNLKMNMDKKYDFKMESILKNNGVMLNGFLIKEEGSNTSAVVYVEPLYEAYRNGSTIIQIVNKIKAQVEHGLVEQKFGTNALRDWEQAKERIVLQVINYEKNQEFLKSIPYKRVFDLAVIFRYYIGQADGKMVTSILQNQNFEVWNVTIDELYDIALVNSIRLLPAVQGRLEAMLLGWDFDDENESENDRLPNIYILSNTYGINGAAVLLYPEELQKLADYLKCDLIILPSSVHEILAVKYDAKIDFSMYQKMVRFVNQESVPEEEVLSDNIYIYWRERKLFEVVPECQ